MRTGTSPLLFDLESREFINVERQCARVVQLAARGHCASGSGV
jgi:hypothetical protein